MIFSQFFIAWKVIKKKHIYLSEFLKVLECVPFYYVYVCTLQFLADAYLLLCCITAVMLPQCLCYWLAELGSVLVKFQDVLT